MKYYTAKMLCSRKGGSLMALGFSVVLRSVVNSVKLCLMQQIVFYG